MINKAHKGAIKTTDTQKQNVSLTPSTEAGAEPIITLLMGMFWIYIVFV